MDLFLAYAGKTLLDMTAINLCGEARFANFILIYSRIPLI